MLKGYYLHSQRHDNSGVDKKIKDQINALSRYFEMEGICLSNDKENKFIKTVRSKVFRIRKSLEYKKALRKINSPDFIYIRKLLLEPKLFKFLDKIKNDYKNCIIIIEIPTFPYLKEMEPDNKISKKNLELEKVGIQRLHDYADRIVTFSEDDEIYGIKTIRTVNGINVDRLPISARAWSEEINVIAVASFIKQHAYERLIESMIRYYEAGGTRKIIAHMVGEGRELPLYKKLAENPFVKDKIIFYGKKTGDDLESIYEKIDMGIGALGLYKIEVNTICAIKTREYAARGLPMIYASKEPSFYDNPVDFALEVSNDDTPIDMKEVIDFYDSLFADGKSAAELHQRIRAYAQKYFDMDITMKPVVDEINGLIKGIEQKNETNITRK